MDSKAGADLVFTTCAGEKVTHIATELEKLGKHFGKKFSFTPPLVSKQNATAVCQTGREAGVRSTVTHSLEVHRSAHQQENTDQCVDRYLRQSA